MPKSNSKGRVCSKCKEFKTWKHFRNFAAGHRGKYPSCSECHKIQLRGYRARNPNTFRRKQRFSYLSAKFGLTKQQYCDMLRKQGGRCGICSTKLYLQSIDQKKTAHVDHCHKTGKVRGLLCHMCNMGIGYLRDDPNNARKAALWLKSLV